MKEHLDSHGYDDDVDNNDDHDEDDDDNEVDYNPMVMAMTTSPWWLFVRELGPSWIK